jgi:hypothetical protein
VGVVVFGLAYLVTDALTASAITTGVASLKEWVYDKYVPNHTVDPMDFWYTMAGGLIGLLISLG